MELRSPHRNGISWQCSMLGEQALLLSPDTDNRMLEIIHELSKALDSHLCKGVLDIVPAYDTIAVIFDGKETDIEELVSSIENLPAMYSEPDEAAIHEIEVCYELGMDWKEVESHTGFKKQEIIEKHSSEIYSVAMMGFIPGFVFLEGLNNEIACPRRTSPRTSIPSGSVGIGGKQTGIYSLESPGGWNIIGRTLKVFFDVSKTPPTSLNPGDKIKFKAISEEEFNNASD